MFAELKTKNWNGGGDSYEEEVMWNIWQAVKDLFKK